MIFYFSGTGNSKWVAEEIAKGIDEKTADIAKLMMKGITTYLAEDDEKIGFVFPIYAWSAPQMVLDFIKGIKLKDSTYTFAVCTCGDEAGYGITILAKKIRLDSGYSIIMPNNYILGFDVDSEEDADRKIEHAKLSIPSICKNVIEKKKVFDCHKGKGGIIKSYMINPLFNLGARRTKPFYAGNDCNGCGICKEICVTANIKIVEGKPKWSSHCTQCLGCINRCPQKAIQYGNKTERKGRYYFKNK